MPGDRRIVLLLLAAGAAALVLIGRLVLPSVQSGPDALALPPPLSVSTASTDSERRGPVLVHVAGAVRRPGVYRLRDGARVRDALRAAGGPGRTAMLEAVNLAARLVDGEQVVVPARGAAASGSATSPGASPTIHLNSATVEELDGLDGIGPALAARIVEYRTAHGGFRSVDDLGQVPGIGPARMEALRGHVAP